MNICSTVAAMTAGGSFDLDELAGHVAGCDECQRIMAVVMEARNLSSRLPGRRWTMKNCRFDLGRVVATPGSLEAMQEAGIDPLTLLARHAAGDWGDLCDEDRAENELSLREGFRILSSYKFADGLNIWIITEWDRSATTFLLPEEY